MTIEHQFQSAQKKKPVAHEPSATPAGTTRPRAEESKTVDVEENILKNVASIYSAPQKGLIEIGSRIDQKLLEPRRKITVMLIGNHSAGKSTFVNWYIDDNSMQKTGVAIETRKFSIIMHGRKADTLRSHAALKLPEYRHFKELERFRGLVENDAIEARISTSRARQFPLCDIIDTPGLVDGEIEYEYDVEEVIEWMADHVDLILVFLDPIGQGLCKRTMNVIQRLDMQHSGKMRFFLAKADQVACEDDRQKLLIQISQNLSSKLNNRTFSLPTIFIPRDFRDKFLGDNAGTSVSDAVPNNIHEICDLIESTIKQKVQSNMSNLGSMVDRLSDSIQTELRNQDVYSRQNVGTFFRRLLFTLLFLAPIFVLVGSFVWSSFFAADEDAQRLADGHVSTIDRTAHRVLSLVSSRPSEVIGSAVAFSLTMFVCIKVFCRSIPLRTRSQRKQLKEDIETLKQYHTENEKFYAEYFHSIGADCPSPPRK